MSVPGKSTGCRNSSETCPKPKPKCKQKISGEVFQDPKLEIKSEVEDDDDDDDDDSAEELDQKDVDDFEDFDDDEDDDFEAGNKKRGKSVDDIRNTKSRNQRPVVKLMSIDRKKSQSCSFCNEKFPNFLNFSNHIFDQHPEKLDERQRLIVRLPVCVQRDQKILEIANFGIMLIIPCS